MFVGAVYLLLDKPAILLLQSLLFRQLRVTQLFEQPLLVPEVGQLFLLENLQQ